MAAVEFVNILILVFVVIFSYNYLYCRESFEHKSKKEGHGHGQKGTKTDEDIIDSILAVVQRINKYQESTELNGPNKQEITEIGMQIHHIDTVDTKDHKLNPIAKIIHADVAHDLLRTYSVVDILLDITKGEDKIMQMTNLVNEINSIPDKNFKPSSKKKLINLIEYMKEQETVF